MEVIQHEAVTTLSSSGQDAPVYNSTTIPMSNVTNGNGTYSSIPTNEPSKRPEDDYVLRPFSNLPAREPVDIQFKDVSYTVKVGFRQGNCHFFFGL